MSGSKGKGKKPGTPPPRSGGGRTRILDVAAQSWVVVRSPRHVPSGTPVAVDGETDVMRTDVPGPLSIQKHGFYVELPGGTWEATALVGSGGTQEWPISVTLAAAGGVQGLSVLQPTQAAGSTIVATGKPADVRTVIYVHGIGNKPVASVLRCQWDKALFGHDMGDRSRMAYWVDRDRYPQPLAETCGDADLVATDDDEASTAAILAIGPDPVQLAGAGREDAAIDRTIDSLTPDEAQRAKLRRIADATIAASDARAQAASTAPGETSARILPGDERTRQMLARLLTRALLPDVYDFLFDAARRQRMTDALSERLRGGGDPFVVVAHSLGTMVAFDVLRRLKQANCTVKLFVTIGSPLGLQEVMDHFAGDGSLAVPDCVERWCNFADRLDPVAIDQTLADDYGANAAGISIEDISVENLDSPIHAHSGSGYLSTPAVRGAVRDAAGLAFVQQLTEMVVTRDVAAAAENTPAATQDVLIQLSDTVDDAVPRRLDTLARTLVERLGKIAQDSGRTLEPPDVLRRFVAAKLIASEIDALRTLSEELHVKQVWANAAKRTMIGNSVSTVQALPARLGYAATGAGINWAVLDTGIDQDHPHFQQYDNLRGQWDCTQPGEPKRYEKGGDRLDPHGHGTHVAGIIGGGMDDVLVGEKKAQLYGMAPQVGLYGFRVLGDNGVGNDGWIIKALDAIAGMNEQSSSLVIHGVNLSLGSNFDPSIYGCGHTPLCQELRRLWRQGVVVCLAAGNDGFAELQSTRGVVNANMALSIGDPANLDEAIAVGSVHKTRPHSYGISYFSSRGPTADGRRKPDLVAPGEKILSALAGGRTPAGGEADANTLYVEMSGTSMASPHVSGLIAAFLSVRREFIGDPDRSKEVLLAACTDLKRDSNMQGAGLPNLVRMVLET